MAIDLSELKQIRSSDTNLIFGFCREAHKQLLSQNDSYHDIQPLIIYTFLAFYYIKHEWDPENISNKCVADGNFLEKSMCGHSSNFLKDEISKGIEEYKFKIINYKDHQQSFTDIGIGVVFIEYFERNQSDIDG